METGVLSEPREKHYCCIGVLPSRLVDQQTCQGLHVYCPFYSPSEVFKALSNQLLPPYPFAYSS